MSASRPSLAKGFIAELDGLRGIAILLVIAHRLWPRSGVGVMADAAGTGWIGVDLFFVISGFLIAGILLDTRGEAGYFRNFYARRVLRIFPLFYLFVGGVLIAFSGNPEFREHAGSPIWYLLHLGNIPEALLDHDVPYWLAPVWSLAIEEQFYLTFPLLVAAVQPHRLGKVLVAMMIAAPVIRIVTMLLAPERERIQYLFTLCRLDTIAVGCLIAVLVRQVDVERHRRRILQIAGAVLGAASAFGIVTELDRTTGVGRTVGYSVVALGCAAAVLLVVLHRGSRGAAILRFAPLTYLGKLCFGLYLLHRPADTIVTALAARAGISADLWLLPVKLALAVALATISWWVIERPFLGLKRLFTSERHPATADAQLHGGAAGHSFLRRALRIVGLASLVALFTAGCHGATPPGTQHDGGVGADAGIDGADARASDARTSDAPSDAHPADAHPADAHPADAHPADAHPADAFVADAFVADAFVADAFVADAPPPDAPPPDAGPPPGMPIYPEDRRHSPITPAVVARLQAIAAAASQAPRVFAKIGDSITASTDFLRCFDGGSVDLGAHTGLAPTINYFLAGNAAGSSPFARSSIAAVGGTTARDALVGSPCTLDREYAAIDPRYAVVMFGTNDVRYGRTLDDFGADLWTIIDKTIAQGVVPVLSSIPPLDGDPGIDARIPTFNRMIRAIAQGRGIPFVDYHRDLLPLPRRGLSTDGIHPSKSPSGACHLTAAGLAYGINVRNLITVEALRRLRAALDGTAADASAPQRTGTGSVADPVQATLPFVDMADTRTGAALHATYTGCGATATGHAIIYQLQVVGQTKLAASVVDRDATDVDIHILSGSLAAGACLAAGDKAVTATVPAGTVYVVIDGRTASSDGEFALVVNAVP